MKNTKKASIQVKGWLCGCATPTQLCSYHDIKLK